MLYPEDFTMRHYGGFSQIGSQFSSDDIINAMLDNKQNTFVVNVQLLQELFLCK